ncbi:hemerythrin hhe cation binding domain-containing [Trichoderma arundinaceum]|uniref:Hemerythrin hhe cation binding domain-containing n=1 Tax=Trichoderma arundinaceum TaxID=490622 RepID=A0A395NZL0_TRIAR|nr:hemerythrin hhe cation binding domain-containing [Trichoderma arundinaceum]
METSAQPDGQQVNTPKVYPLIETPQYATKQTDKLTLMATEMACVHNCILRCLNAIHKHAPTVQPAEYEAFISFVRIWYTMVMKHHDGEEQYIFPRFQEQIHPEAMVVSQQEHEAFHDGMEEMMKYVNGLKGRENEFDRVEFCRIMDSFSDALVTHLRNEVPAILKLGELGDVDAISKIWDSAVQEDIKKFKMVDFITLLPLAIFSHDAEYEGGLHRDFPPLPAAMKFVVRRVLSRPYQGAWKFLVTA